MTDLKSVAKLIDKIRELIEQLESLPVLIIHQKINQFYYMQKATELEMLHEQLEELLKKAENTNLLLEPIYYEVASCWIRDIRWLKSQPELKAVENLNH